MAVLTGGQCVVRMFQAHGVDLGFGMGGFQALPYYDALAQQTMINHVVIRDEKHGAFAADGFARIRNRPAVADATLGPGATNLLSGAAESQGASIPLILMTSDVNSGIALRGATQESRQFEMLRPACKESLDIRRIDRLPELLRRAFASANGGRPGPVNLNISEDVFHGMHDFPEHELFADPRAIEVGCVRPKPSSLDVDTAVSHIRRAQTPVLIAGGGVHLSGAHTAVVRFAELAAIPVATTITGKGTLPETHPLALGICGRYSRYANEFIARADLIIVVGCKLGEIATNRWTVIPPNARIIHIDIDPGELGKVYRTELGIWADAKATLDALIDSMGPNRGPRRTQPLEQLEVEIAAARERWSAVADERYRSDDAPVHMARLLKDLRVALPSNAILVADGGFAAHWSALLFEVLEAGRTYVANRGHAAIGYGLPGAIGVKLAAPKTPVVAICGDNGFAMAVAELETAKRAGANLIAVVVNNGSLGYVKALQHSLYEGRYQSVDFLDVDYAAVGRAFGVEGRRVTSAAELAGAFRWALEVQQSTPVVLDVLTTTDPAQMLPDVDSRTRMAQAPPQTSSSSGDGI